MILELQDYLHRHIPISSAMGVKVSEATTGRVVLSAPLNININHQSTVFGGSLHAVATLACWSLLHLNLNKKFDSSKQIVITESKINYLAPVTNDFFVECDMVDPNEWERFSLIFEKKGKGRIMLQSKIYMESNLCVDYTGTFAAMTGKAVKGTLSTAKANEINL